MACNDVQVRVASRRLVKASDSTIAPHVLAVSNLDLLAQTMPVCMFCVYPKPPPTAEFTSVVAAFESGLPSLLNHFFPFAGRIATDPNSGLPEVHCRNQGAELVVGHAGVALASLDYANISASLRRIQQPYGEDDVALSVQVVSFACGGFTVAWCTNHVLVDGCALSLLVTAWSELARTGTLAAGSLPSHDRSVFRRRPRAPPRYSASLDEAFTPLDDGERQVNVLTRDQSFVERLYHVDASDVARLREAASREGDQHRATTRVQAVSAYLWKLLARVVEGTADERCRMGWWLNGRWRLVAAPELRNYVGNVTTFAVREARVADVLRMPLPDVAAMVRDAVAAPEYERRFQELVDWVEEHKGKRYVETETMGLGSPTVIVTAFTSFRIDTDFGFGRSVMTTPMATSAARLCSGFVQITAQPGVDEGAWIVNAFLWPRLAAALETDEPRVFKPVTAEYLGLQVAPKVPQSRL